MDRSTRFTPTHSRDRLLQVVHEVSVHADPAAPADVSQRRFNAARAVAGHPDCPQAHAIAERLGVSWPLLLRTVHTTDNRSRLVSVLASDRGRKGITLDHVLTAIRLVARYLRVSALSLSEYDRGREELVAGDKRAWAHGGQAELMFPTRNQIDEVLHQNELTWTEALARAGLERAGSAHRGMSVADAVALFAADTGHVPFSNVQMRSWAKQTGHVVVNHLWADVEPAIAEFQRQREVPLPTWPRGKSFEGVTTTVPPRRRKPKHHRSPEEIVRGLTIAFDFLKPGEALGERTLKRISKQYIDEDIPSWGAVVTAIEKCPGASWDKWLDEAARRHAGEPPRVVEEL